MIRRARLSFKPNVRPGGRASGAAAVSGRDGGVAPQPERVQDSGPEESVEPAVTGEETEQHEKTITASNESQPTKISSAPLQRRKRISTLPNLVKPRVSNSTPVVTTPSQKPPQVELRSTVPVSSVPCKIEVSPPEKGKLLSPPKSPAPLAPSQGQHVALPEKRTPVPNVPQFSPYKKSVLKHPEVTPVKTMECIQKEEPSPLKERPSQKSSINEELMTMKQITPKKIVGGNLEKERLRRSQKLRELLRDELRKERKAWKEKHPVIPTTAEPERSRMVMRDFIHFIPANNPMNSSIEEIKTSEKSPPAEPQVTGALEKNINNVDEDDPDEEEDDSQSLAPRVKVAEDGSIILDEESLTVEVIRNKAPIVEGNDPIFERGSTTTYSSFRRNTYSKPWSNQETDMFFLAISMVGTDFSMIGQLFPHRERTEIKNKFKREERSNGWRIDKAFREKTAFDFEFFAHLLEKALEAGKKKQKTPRTKQPREKKTTKSRKKQKDKSAAEQNLNNGESAILSEGEGADARTAEKENEGSLGVKECCPGSDPAPGKKRRARKKKEDTKEPEEENRESQDDDLSQMPKKEKKPKNKSKITSEDKDHNPEPESAENDESLVVQAERKRRVRKKKPDAKETELEDDENGGTDTLQGSKRNKSIAKTSCDIPQDAEDDAHAFNETAEVDMSESAALPCEEESSLVLFTEESECHSELDELSSKQDSLAEVLPPVTQDSDVSSVAQNITFGADGSMDPSQVETSPAARDHKSDSSKEVDAGDGEPEQRDLEPKDMKKSLPLLRGRSMRPVPNLSKASVKKKVPAEERGDTELQTASIDHIEDAGEVDVDKKKPQEEDLVVDRQTETGAKSEESTTSHIVHKESSIKPAPLMRGRIQRPKPNIQVETLTRREKPEATEANDTSAESTEQSTDVSIAISQSCKVDSEEVDVSSVGENHRQDCSVSAPVSCPVQKDLGSESALSQPGEPDADSIVSDSTKGDINKEKPSQTARGRLLRPKPNLTKAPAKNKPFITEQDIHHTSHSQDSGQVSSTDTKSPSCTAARDQITAAEEKTESSSISQDECRKSPIKPAPLVRGRFQRPNPNVIKSSARKEKLDVKEDPSGEFAGDRSRNVPSCIENDDSSGKEESKTSVYENGGFGSTSAQDSCHSEKTLCADPLSSLQRAKENDSIPGVSAVNQDLPTESTSTSQAECRKSPIKPAPLTRGRLQRPKPNLLKTSGRKGASEVREGETFEVPSEDTVEKRSLDNDDSSVSANSAELMKEVPALDESCGQEESCSEPPGPAQPVKGDLEPKPNVSLTEEPQQSVKPAVLPRGRFQRPKPNLGRAVTKRDVLTSPNEPKSLTKLETHVQKAGESDESTSNVSACQAEKSPSHTKSDKEDSICGGKAVTQSYTPLQETLHSEHALPSVERTDNVEAAATSEDHSAHVIVNKELSGSEEESKLCAVKIQSIQHHKEDTQDGSVFKEPMQHEEAAHTGEQGEGSSVKPMRSRFQKPRPNLGRASVRKEAPSIDPRTSASEQDDVKLEVISKIPEPLKNDEATDSSLASHGSKEAGPVNEEKSTAIKPAQLRRGRLVRPVPNLVKLPTKRPSLVQSKKSDEVEESPVVAKDKAPAIEMNLSSPVNKRKASESNIDVSPKRSRLCDKSHKPSLSSDSEVAQGSLPNDLQDSSQSRDVQEDSNPPLSRFGRPLRKTVPTTPPVLPKPSDKSSERLENEKTARSVKPTKSKVSSPVSNKRKGKTTLVKLRATQQEDDDDEEEDAELDFEEDNYNLAPDMLNQAPVFVPFSLRSPRPVPAEIEETVEEFEIPLEVVDVLSNTSQESGTSPVILQHVLVSQAGPDNEEHCDGSTEAAMTLISMGNSVFQTNTGESLSSDHCTENELPPSTEGQTDLEPLTRLKPLSSPSAEFPSNNKHAVCAVQNDAAVNARLEESHPDVPSLPAVNGSFPGPDTTKSDSVLLNSAFDSSHILNDNLVLPIEQMSYPGILEEAPHGLMSQHDGMSDSMLDSGSPAEEATFILTLVEIPISEEYDYSCDSNSADALPAPVMISSGSSQSLTQPQSQSSASPVFSEPVSYEPCPVVQEDTELMSGQSSRKRNASGFSGGDEIPPEKRVLLDNSAEQREENMINAAAVEADCNKRSSDEAWLTDPRPEETSGFSQTSTHIPDFPFGEEKLPDSAAANQSDRVHIDNPATASRESLNRNILPSACANAPSSSKTPLKRPGRKPLGFLSLVCKDKKPKETSEVTPRKKSLPKPKCKKRLPSLVQRPQEDNPVLNQEDVPSNEVPSPSPVLSPAVTLTHETEQTNPPICQVSDNQPTEPQESPKSLDLATEEEAAPVSEYFFSDIFMQVDD